MIKRTCNAAEQSRMRKMGLEGYTLNQISKNMGITLECVTRNMVGHKCAKVAVTEDVQLETVVADEDEVQEDTRSPQQKAADTRKANKAAKEVQEENDDPGFLE